MKTFWIILCGGVSAADAMLFASGGSVLFLGGAILCGLAVVVMIVGDA